MIAKRHTYRHRDRDITQTCLNCSVFTFITRCAVAQYAVLEANAKVNGIGPFSHPRPSEAPQPISMSCQIYYYVPPQGVDVQNLVEIDSAVTDLRMREKKTVCVDFFINISHARTVVRVCCKGDDESQWERGKFDPPPPKTP